MTQKQKESNNHHFLPRSVLRRFSVNADRKSVMVFDKTSGSSWWGGLDSTGSSKGYNVLIAPDGSRLNFESDFDELDKIYARVGDELSERRTVASLDTLFKSDLVDVLAAQMVRTPIIRSTLHRIPRDLSDRLRSKGLAPFDGQSLPSDDLVRQVTRDLLADSSAIKAALAAKEILLFEPSGTGRFWISDHPVVRYSQMPLGETGLISLGVEIYFPLASDLVIGFRDRKLSHATATADRGVGLGTDPVDEAFRLGIPLKVNNAVVNFFNSLQVESAQRFLYASNDDFELARMMLQRNPSLANNPSLVHVGEMGRAPPRPKNMPPGEWLYLESREGYLLIPIQNYRAERMVREMTTEATDLLSMAIAKGQFDRAEVFAHSGGGATRNVKLVLVEQGPPARFRIVFSDPTLQVLDEAIARHSKS